MVWSSTPLAAHTDTPTLCAVHALERPYGSVSPPLWTRGAGFGGSPTAEANHGTFNATGVNDPDFPIANACNRDLGGEDTRPAANTAAEYYLMLRTTSTTPKIDTLVLSLGNAALTPGGISARLETADSDDWLTNPQTIWDFGAITTNKRQVKLLPDQWSGVTRLRLRLTAGQNFTPQVTELWVTLRRVVGQFPIAPYDDWHQQAWAAALVLIVFVLFMNILSDADAAKRPPKFR